MPRRRRMDGGFSGGLKGTARQRLPSMMRPKALGAVVVEVADRESEARNAPLFVLRGAGSGVERRAWFGVKQSRSISSFGHPHGIGGSNRPSCKVRTRFCCVCCARCSAPRSSRAAREAARPRPSRIFPDWRGSTRARARVPDASGAPFRRSLPACSPPGSCDAAALVAGVKRVRRRGPCPRGTRATGEGLPTMSPGHTRHRRARSLLYPGFPPPRSVARFPRGGPLPRTPSARVRVRRGRAIAQALPGDQTHDNL
jgi:hypothetical protein